MRISELSRASEVPVPTIKFYLREGLLPEGRLTSATQAQYGEEHLDRLRLIRALTGAGGLSVSRTRNVLHAIDHPPASTHDLLGVAHGAVTPPAPAGLDLTGAQDLIRSWGWYADDLRDCDAQAALAIALQAVLASGLELPPESLRMYAEQVYAIAEAEVAGVPTDSPDAAVRYVVLGTVLLEPVLLALRRLAQIEASARRFDAEPAGRGPQPSGDVSS